MKFQTAWAFSRYFRRVTIYLYSFASQVKSFLQNYPDAWPVQQTGFDLMRQIQHNMAWMGRNGKQVGNWLKNEGTENLNVL